MSTSEFRYNKKRKHYAYLFKRVGLKYRCIILTSKEYMIRIKKGKNKVTKNIKLFRHPNIEKKGIYYVVVRIYEDDSFSFSEKTYDNWNFDKHDKRKIKRLKKGK